MSLRNFMVHLQQPEYSASRTPSTFRPLVVFGTRPEAIKLAPLIKALQADGGTECISLCTGQHRELMYPALEYFDVTPDIQLDVMAENQSLAGLSECLLREVSGTIESHSPTCVIAQGDTTTVFISALAAFYSKIPFCHIEAGLRTYDLSSPWPEEFNRRAVSLCTDLHFAPTSRAQNSLILEGIDPAKITVTGNTVIDALEWARRKESGNGNEWSRKWGLLGKNRMILVTGHRRENFGEGFRNICEGLRDLAVALPDVHFVYPVHLNPNVQLAVMQTLAGLANFHLTAPATYPEFIWLMERAFLIVTDSGGVQEEGPSFRKPIIVTRTNTERPEAVDAGAVTLVGPDRDRLKREVLSLCADEAKYRSRLVDTNPYGDGRASQRIKNVLRRRFIRD